MSAKKTGAANLFCKASDLTNEASVESFFVMPLLKHLGYENHEIRTKKSIGELKIPAGGRKRELYKPDFLVVSKRPRWLIDAKSTEETLEDWTYQCAGYSLLINRKYEDRPCRFFMLTKGLRTLVYQWDQEQAILSLRFDDFAKDNPKFVALERLLAADVVRKGWPSETMQAAASPPHLLIRPSMEDVKKTFLKCHRIIWKAEKVNPQAAFIRFAKILFVKLWEDRRVRDNAEWLAAIGRSDPLPAEAVRFSTRWIKQQEENTENPVDRILFRDLVESLEQEIQAKKRKRIFETGAKLDVGHGTVRRIVKELEHQYLFGIDEDLNGRMFEAFLVATMRGKELGQFFTPRSIVKLITRLGKPIASPSNIERVLDGCCGTGGFLIEALTEMRRQVYENKSLTNTKRVELLNEIANEAIFGIDAGQEPPLVRIARINMYLHGDGGSRVYMADALRKTPAPSGTDTAEGKQEVLELKKALEGDKNSGPLLFDLVLTNPPFSMDYSMDDPDEHEVLEDYDLRTWEDKQRPSLRSAIMFMERYYDLLEPGGRLLTVIDDGVLGGKKMAFVRDFLRKKYIINGIISLHGDAFRRAGARTKTSILCLSKRQGEDEVQPDVFVYESRYIGLDDVPSKTRPSVATEARKMATEEMDKIVSAYGYYLSGEKGPWLVKADRVGDRLDAKFLNPWSVEKLGPTWTKAGASTETLGALVDHIKSEVKIQPKNILTFLRISYSGYATKGESVLGSEISYPWVGQAKEDDIVVSNINAVNGATCVIPKKAENYLVTSEFTVLRIKPERRKEVDSMYLWAVLRSPAIIAEWLSSSTGLGRHRVNWELLQKQRVPLLSPPAQKMIADLNRKDHALYEEMIAVRESAIAGLTALDLYGEIAKDKLARAKPPK